MHVFYVLYQPIHPGALTLWESKETTDWVHALCRFIVEIEDELTRGRVQFLGRRNQLQPRCHGAK